MKDAAPLDPPGPRGSLVALVVASASALFAARCHNQPEAVAPPPPEPPPIETA